MKQRVSVSVVLPTFNRASTLAKAIESALGQTYKDFELIVVDDGSRDETQGLLSGYARKDARVIFMRNRENMGLVRSLNKGIQHAQGRYIARLDDDDFWFDARKLEKQVSFLEKNQEYALTGGGQIRVDEHGKEIARLVFPETDKAIRRHMLFSNPFAHTSVLFRKESWARVGGYDESLDFSEDWDLWMKLGSIGKLHNFQEYFVCYLQGNQNRSNEHMVRDALLNVKLRITYRKNFPGFLRAFGRGCLAVVYAILPFRPLARIFFHD